MHDLPLSPQDRTTLLEAIRASPYRDRLLAELVFGHGLGIAEALAIRLDAIAWGADRVKLDVPGPRGARRAVTVDRATVEGAVGDRRTGPLFATASGVPIRGDYASRLLVRIAEGAGVPSGLSARRLRARRAVGA